MFQDTVVPMVRTETYLTPENIRMNSLIFYYEWELLLRLLSGLCAFVYLHLFIRDKIQKAFNYFIGNSQKLEARRPSNMSEHVHF